MGLCPQSQMLPDIISVDSPDRLNSVSENDRFTPQNFNEINQAEFCKWDTFSQNVKRHRKFSLDALARCIPKISKSCNLSFPMLVHRYDLTTRKVLTLLSQEAVETDKVQTTVISLSNSAKHHASDAHNIATATNFQDNLHCLIPSCAVSSAFGWLFRR